LAIKVLKAGTPRQGKRAIVRLCANGCGQPATAYDIKCGKHLCWFHLVMEHPHQVDCDKSNGRTPTIYTYYGP
jgi:hypothetical protein